MLAQWYAPLIGGEESHVRNLSHELVRRGHEVSVATLWQPGLPEVEDDDGVTLHRLRGSVQRAGWLFADGGRRSAPPAPDPGTTIGLARLVDTFRPDIVHAHNWMVHAYLPLKRRHGPRLVVSLHDFSLVCATKVMLNKGAACDGPGFQKCLACAAAHYGPIKGAVTAGANWTFSALERRLVDLFLPVSKAVAMGTGLADGQTPYEVVPNFAPDSIGDLVPGPRDPRLPAGDYLLYVGAFAGLKGVDRLLAACRSLAPRPPLVMIGYRAADTNAILADLPDDVVVHESWSHGEVMRAWAGAQAGIIPSVAIEACPSVAIEAMATGTPVIASRIGGLPDLVTDEATGLLVTPGETDALRAALRRMLVDPALRERLGQGARARFSEFAAGTVVPRVEAAYERVSASAGAESAKVVTS